MVIYLFVLSRCDFCSPEHGGFVPREWQAEKGPIDCLLTMFLTVCSVTQTNILEGIRRLRLFYIKKKIVLSFRLSFFVMKAHVHNSYIKHKQLKQRNINCEKYVRKFWDLESMILLEKTFLDYLLLVELLVVMVFKS